MFEVIFQITLIGSIFAFVWFSVAYSYRKRKQMMEVQAAKRNGRVLAGSVLSHPQLLIPFASSEMSLRFWPGGKNSPPTFEASLPVKFSASLTINIKPEDLFHGVGKFFGMQDIRIGNSSFDAAYLIQANSERQLRKFLNPELQTLLLQLQEQRPLINLNNDKLTLHFRRFPRSEQELDELIEMAMQIFKALEQYAAPRRGRNVSSNASSRKKRPYVRKNSITDPALLGFLGCALFAGLLLFTAEYLTVTDNSEQVESAPQPPIQRLEVTKKKEIRVSWKSAELDNRRLLYLGESLTHLLIVKADKVVVKIHPKLGDIENINSPAKTIKARLSIQALPQCKTRTIVKSFNAPKPRIKVISADDRNQTRKKIKIQVFGRGKILVRSELRWTAGTKVYTKSGPRFTIKIPQGADRLTKTVDVRAPATNDIWRVEFFPKNSASTYTEETRKRSADYDAAIDFVRMYYEKDSFDTSRSPRITSAEFYQAKGHRFMIIGVNKKDYIFRGMAPKIWSAFKSAPSLGEFYNGEIQGKYSYCDA